MSAVRMFANFLSENQKKHLHDYDGLKAEGRNDILERVVYIKCAKNTSMLQIFV